MEIFWSEESQEFITIPDGDTATPREIKNYYENNKEIEVEIKWR